MLIFADTHVHIYPLYDIEQLLDSFWKNISRIERPELQTEAVSGALESVETVRVMCLTERADCKAFCNLADMGKIGKWTISKSDDEDCVVAQDNGSTLFVIAGRQIISREGIEVLALTRDLKIDDGLPVEETLRIVREKDAIAVLPWSPGKWFGRRGEIIGRLFESNASESFLVGDVFMRPWIWPEPRLMKMARALGFRIVAGSDPLPFTGEEKIAGRYVTLIEGAFESEIPATSMRTLFRAPEASFRLAPSRSGVYSMFRRFTKNRKVSKLGLR